MDGEARARVKFPSDDVQSVKLPPVSMSRASALLSRTSNNTLNKNEGKLCDIFLKFAFATYLSPSKEFSFHGLNRKEHFCHFPQ